MPRVLTYIFLSIFFTITVCINFTIAQTVNFEWVKQIGGSSYDDGKDVHIDAAGNIYYTGYFTGTVDMDPGPGVFNLSSPLDNEEEVFICKLDINGNFLWAKQFTGNFLDVAYSIKVDAFENVYLTGIFFRTCDFDPGPGVFNLVSQGNEDVFIVKLNPSGNLLWAKSFGAALYDRGNSLSLDAAGNVYVTGFFQQTVDFDPGPGVYNITSAGTEDMFIVKLSSAGNFIWAKQIGGPLFEGGYSLTVTPTGNIYTTGIFLGQSDFDPSSGIYQLNSTGLMDVFVSKMDTDGNFKWAKRMGGNSYVRSFSLALDEAENIYTTGLFDKQVDFDPGPADYTLTSMGQDDMFISKLDSNGNFVWARQVGAGSFDLGTAVCTDATGNVYVTGYFQESVDFDPGPGIFNLNSNGLSDIFILKLDANGNFNFAKQIGGTSFDGPNSIRTDAAFNIYVTGNFERTVDFDPESTVFELTSNGNNDGFLLKLSQCLATSTLIITATTCNSYTLNNQVYSSSGIYTQVLKNAADCDSIITLNLSISRQITINDITICEGQPYFAAGAFQNTTGMYTDTLLNVSGCDSVVVTNLTVNPSPKPNLGADKNLCVGEQLLLDPGLFNRYLWNNGSLARTLNVSSPGIYWVRVTDSNSCNATDSFTISKINSLPADFLPANKELCSGDAVILKIPGFNNYTWSTGESNNEIIVRTPGLYTLEVIDGNSCKGKDSISISPKTNCIPVAIPNSFTPNNDGLNDRFKPIITMEVFGYSMQIFNRWGQRIFISNSALNGWDGTNKGTAPGQAVYVYVITFKDFQGKKYYYRGTVLLIQ